MYALERKAKDIRREYKIYREKMMNEGIQLLSPSDKEELMQRFDIYAEPVVKTILSLQRKKYKRENVHESPQVKALYRQFMLREVDMLNIPSLEEFVAELPDEQIEDWQKLKSCDPDHPLLHYSE